MTMSDRPSVLVIAGPTASGKTEAALAVAERFDGVVMSADAMQVYRGMDIGTAKVTDEERARVTHFGIDMVNPDESFDANDFVAEADRVVAMGKPVIIAGGTSFYLRAFIRGLVQTPTVDPALRAELEASDGLHERLQAVDPVLAARLHPNDRVRLIRGLEVYLQSGKRLSDLQAEHKAQPDRVRAVGLCLERDDLYDRINRRVLMMMEAGYLAEVEALLGKGYDRSLKPMLSLGYRHLTSHLLDGLPLEEAVRLTQRDTRHFSRKQRTWMNTLKFPKVAEGHVEAAMSAAAQAFSG